ncbi:hypothetical protein SKAU_G00344320 [Synaphobranchus kaupii]|uniref:Uncharacterized protein n=1 Tax=Synaphobranchus kaupii TaxID=118154 RepID=A0A9Q1EJ55_SYNKA|nr:hypothetical protein SKAU_G00344320 [Synaphobranchus kaupii]
MDSGPDPDPESQKQRPADAANHAASCHSSAVTSISPRPPWLSSGGEEARGSSFHGRFHRSSGNIHVVKAKGMKASVEVIGLPTGPGESNAERVRPSEQGDSRNITEDLKTTRS